MYLIDLLRWDTIANLLLRLELQSWGQVATLGVISL